MAQKNFYPGKTIDDICVTCYTGQASCTKSQGCQTQAAPCASNCNTKCLTAQTYCNIGYQSISSHGDVGSFSGFKAPEKGLIFKSWTAEKWNLLQKKFEAAMDVGQKVSQGVEVSFTRAAADPDNKDHPDNSLITADKYNEFVAAINGFGGKLDEVVAKKTPIMLSHSTDLDNGFTNAKFKTTVCDLCNAGKQYSCTYNCSCNYQCSCNHHCSCVHQKVEEKEEDDDTSGDGK
jgi:hypothetical protein